MKYTDPSGYFYSSDGVWFDSYDQYKLIRREESMEMPSDPFGDGNHVGPFNHVNADGSKENLQKVLGESASLYRKNHPYTPPGGCIDLPETTVQGTKVTWETINRHLDEIWGGASNANSGVDWINMYQNEYANFVTGAGNYMSIVGKAIDWTARDLKNAKYISRGENLINEAKTLVKYSKGLSIVGGVVGAFDNGAQAYNDYLKGNYVRSSIQATQSLAYTAGLICMAIPGGQVLGAGIIFYAGVSDLIEWGIESEW